MTAVREGMMVSVLRSLGAFAAFLAFYIFAGVFVLRYLTENGIVAVFWPPTGIALAALLLGGRRYIPVVFIGAFFVNQLAGARIVPGLIYAGINTLEGLVAWFLLTRVSKIDLALAHARDYFQIFLYGGVVAPFVGALLGAITLYLSALAPQDFWHNLQYWWMGDSLGVIILTPLLLIWRRRPTQTYTSRQWIEAAVGLSALVFVGQIVFAGWSFGALNAYGRGFIFFIFVSWAAMRFGRHATSLAIAILIIQIMVGLVAGRGYFAAESRSVMFGTIWLYMTAISVTGMALAIYIYEARLLNHQLTLAREHLEQVNALAHIGGWEFDIAENSMRFSREALRILDLPEDADPDLATALSFIDESEQAVHMARGQLAMEQGIGWDAEFALRTRSGRQIWVRSQGRPISENGRVVRLIGALHDLTESRYAQIALKKRELEFRRLVETASEGIWTIDEHGSTTFVNRRMAELLGYQPHEMLGTHFLEYIPAEWHGVATQQLQRRREGVSESQESVLLHRSGKKIWVMASTSPIRDEAGVVVGALAMISDISERKTIEEQLKQSEARYRQLVESSADAIVVHQSGFIVYLNEPAVRLLKAHDTGDLIGRNVLELVAPEFRTTVIERMKLVNGPGGHVPLVEEKFLRLDGTTVDVEVSASGTLFNGLPATMVVARDITDRKRAEAQIRYLGQHDILTGLPNRALFADRLAQTIAMADRHHGVFALLFLDLDHFKKINDSYGHRAGDAFLRQVAERLTGCVRAINTVSRQGGDEFIVLLNDLAHPEDAGTIAREICERLSEPFDIGEIRLHASVSVGIAVYPKDGSDADTLLRNADIAMYHAKGRGRNQYQFFSEELNRITQQRLDIELALRRAIAENQFYLVYQPQLNLQTGAIEGFEALIRWRHPVRGELSPLEFIPIAEESGQIAALGEWVLRKVLSDMPQFDAAGHDQLRIAVNVSALELRQTNFADRVLKLLEEFHVLPMRLELEVTESMLMEDTQLAAQSIQRLSSEGIKFAIDDFGTGYSSLSYLRTLRIHHLKIDRSFISDLAHDADDAAIVRTIIALAQNLRLKAVAEGVETQEQRDFLRNHGCEIMQGFYLSRPLELPAALKFLSDSVR
ncbi:MAG TPA: EAL domain-containing protein [Turneriella sp.]|nr:EAL domain-containing protein [Turneriella sp.]